jgi:flagellar hook assembly protein FlgD
VIIKVDSDLISSLTDPIAQYSSSRIESVSPNPFNGNTRISFSMDESLKTEISVFNLQGQLIIMLADQTYPAGKHEIKWDGKDDSGNEIPSGIYLLKLLTEKGIDLKKLIVSY